MFNLFKIAFRNLYRQTSRTILTVGLIALGVLAVLLFTATAGSFKNMMIGQITDTTMGHIQVHPDGYVETIENMPLNLNLSPDQVEKVDTVLGDIPSVEAHSTRILLGAGLSNYKETTNVRLTAINPEQETKVVPLLDDKLKKGHFLEQGEILVPELVAEGMDFDIGSDVVLIATNEEGSVNGINLQVAGIIETALGPSGKFGYIHLQDAKKLLRMDTLKISEIAVRLDSLDQIETVLPRVREGLGLSKDSDKEATYEVHSWRALHPFSTLANIIDLSNWFVQVILVGVVLISIMNVMMMAVYERTSEIGTLSAIGTPANRILGMFLSEGLLLGIIGTIVGLVAGEVVVQFIQFLDIRFSFGMMDNVPLQPTLKWADRIFISLLVIFVTLLGVLQPSFKASRLEPVEALDQ